MFDLLALGNALNRFNTDQAFRSDVQQRVFNADERERELMRQYDVGRISKDEFVGRMVASPELIAEFQNAKADGDLWNAINPTWRPEGELVAACIIDEITVEQMVQKLAVL